MYGEDCPFAERYIALQKRVVAKPNYGVIRTRNVLKKYATSYLHKVDGLPGYKFENETIDR